MHWLLVCFLVCVFFLLVLLLSVYLQLGFLLYLVERFCHSALFRFKQRLHLEHKLLALTIDDAPTRHNTPRILEILRLWNVRATFFVIGNNALQHEDIMKEIVAQGHEIGNHTMFDFPSVKLDPHSLLSEIRQTDEIINHAYEMAQTPRPKTKWFRPGSGFYNKTITSICAGEGYRIALGSCYPFDAQIASVGWNSKHVLLTASPGRIIIIHDRPNTPSLLERVLPKLVNAGYTFGTLSELSTV